MLRKPKLSLSCSSELEVMSTCCHAEFPYGATDGGSGLARCTYEGEWKDSREAAHVEKFQQEDWTRKEWHYSKQEFSSKLGSPFDINQ